MIYLLMLLSSIVFSQEENSKIREANELYKAQKFNDAEVLYKKSLELNGKSLPAQYNLGNTNYKMKNYEGALNTFEQIANNSSLDAKTRAKAFHNIGNTHLNSQKYEEAIEAYKNSLKANPGDKETIYNLEYAKRQLANQQNQQNQDNKDNQDQQDKKDQNENKDNKNNKDNKDQNKQDKKDDKKQDKNQDKQDKSQQNQDKNQQNQDKAQNGEQKDQQKKDEKGQSGEQKQLKISKEDAERMLQALAKQEKQTQMKIRKLEKNNSKIEKNW